eukprot:TCALIF_07911-PA protein Name:"Similar to Nid2 Nidogen-2 (Rattus norvegicus)" AED:0.21 eAED:0.21 QI:0/1/0.77/1/0.87/1/9/315/2645
MNTSEKFLKLFQLSRLCDGVDDCFMGSDELRDEHKCSEGCGSTCQFGVCITTKTNGDRCLCNEGFGGEGCDIADTNECRYKPCSMFAECTNTLGSFQCKCLPGYQGDGFHCESIPVNNDTSSDASSGVSDQFGDQDDDNSNVIGGGVGGLFAPAKDGSSNQNEVVNDTLSEISKPVAPSHVPGNTSADQHDDVPSSVKEGGESHGLSANQQPSNRGEDSEKSEDAIVFPTGNLPSSEGNQVRTDTKEDGNHDGGSSLAGDVREDPIVVGFDPNTFEPIFSPKEEPAASTKGPFIDLGLDDPIKALSEILRDKTFGPSEGPDQRTPEKSDSPITINYDLDYEYPELGLSPSSPRTSDQPITILYDLDYDYRENSLDPDFVPETTEEQSSLESSNETIANDQSLPDFIAPEQMSDEPTNTQHPIGQQPMNILPNERKKERVPSVSNSALDFTLNSNNNESEDISNEDALIQPSGPALLPDLSRERPTTEKDTQSSAGESDEISQESLIPETTPKIISDPIRETFQEMVAQDNILKPSTTGPNQEIEETLSTLENTSPEISKSDTDTEFVQNEMKSNPDVDFRTTLVPDHARNRPTEIQSTLDNIMSSTSKPSNRSGPPLNQKEIEAFSSESSFSGSDVAPFDGNNPIPNIGTKATPKENLVPVEEVVFIPEHAGEKPTEVSSSKGSSRVSTMPPFFPDNIQDDNLDQSSTMVLQDDEPGQSQAIDPSTTSGIKQRLNSVKDTIAVGSPDETNLFQGPISKPNLIPDHTKDKPTELVEDVKDSGALNASSNEDAIIEFGDSLSSNEKPTLLPEHALHKPTEFVPSNVHSPVKTFTHDMIKNPGQEPMLIPDHAKGRPTTLFSNGSPTNSFLPSGLEDHLKSNQVSSNEHFIPEHARDKPTEFAIGEIGSPVTENSQSIQDNLNQEQVLLPKEPTTFVPDESSSKTKIGSEDPLKANPENGQEYLIPDHDKDKPTELVPNDANAPVLVTETSHDIQMGSDQEQILIPEHAKENAPIIGPHSFEPPEVLAPQEPMLIPNHEGQEPTKGISKAEIKTDLMTESPDGSAIPPWVSDPSENEPFGGINTPNQPGFSLRPFKPSLVPDHAQERPVEIVSAEVPSTINPQGRPVSNFVPSPDLRKPDVIGEKPTDMSSNNQDQKSPNVNLFEFLASSTPFSRTDEDFPNDEQSNSGNSVTLLYDLDYELDPSDQIQDQFETTSSVLRPAEEAPTSSNPVKVMFQTNNGDKNNQIPHLSIDVDPTLGLVRTTTVASIDQTGVTPEQEEPSENQRATTSRPFEVKFSLPDVQLPYPPSDSNVDISPQFDTNVQISDDNMGNVGLSTDAKASDNEKQYPGESSNAPQDTFNPVVVAGNVPDLSNVFKSATDRSPPVVETTQSNTLPASEAPFTPITSTTTKLFFTFGSTSSTPSSKPVTTIKTTTMLPDLVSDSFDSELPGANDPLFTTPRSTTTAATATTTMGIQSSNSDDFNFNDFVEPEFGEVNPEEPTQVDAFPITTDKNLNTEEGIPISIKDMDSHDVKSPTEKPLNTNISPVDFSQPTLSVDLESSTSSNIIARPSTLLSSSESPDLISSSQSNFPDSPIVFPTSTNTPIVTLTNQGDDSLGIQDETSEPPTRAQLPDQNLLKNPFDPFPIPNLELGVDFDGNGSKEFETKHHSPKVDQGEIRNEGRESFEEDLEVQIPINNYPQFEVDLIRGRVKEATTTTQSQFNGINPRFPLKVHDTLEEHLGVPIPSRTDGLFKDTPPQKTSSDTSSHSGQDSKVKYPLQEHFETSVPHESSNSPTERVQTDSEKSSSNPEMDDLEPFEAQSEELDETNGSQSILDVLQPCSIGYSNCGSGKPIDQDVDQVCQKQFNQCAISRLNTAQTLESDIRNQLINSFQSSPDLLQCILTHQACIVPNKKMCMANFQHCALNALNGISRLTTPSSVAKQAPQPTTPTSTIREGVPQGPTKLDQAAIEELMGTLQQNFTICIQSHTVCLDNGISHAICQHSFKECSLAILVDSKLNETSLFELEEQVEETQDQPLATELYQCIRNFMMCQMSNQNRYCMRDYQKCSLSAMPQKSTSSPRPTTRLPNVPPRRARPSQIHSNPRPIEPALRSPGGFILGPSHGLSHSPPPYIDPSTGILIHSPQFRTPVVPNLGPECQQMGITADFGSFGGRPAQSVADCTWDFFGCTRRRGVWPANKPCCQARFDACCSHVMGTPNGPSHSQSTSRPSSIGQGSNNGGYPPIQEVHTTTRQPTTTTPRPTTTTRTTTVASTSQRPGFDRDGNPVRMIDCIWTYNGCVKRRQKPDSQCKSEFNACSMIAMGMVPQEASSSTTTTTTTTTTTKKPIQDIDLAELPEFLKPPTDSDTNQKPPRPIQDIDLPSNQEVLEFQPGSQDSFQHNDLALNHPEGFGSNEFLSCLLRLHDCEENGITNCRNVQRCKNEGPIFSPIESEGGEQVGSFEPGSGPTDTPDDCKMSFHNCGLTKTENDCRREFSKCSGGSQPDYEICADVAEHPQNYLVPHPEDCTKFYSCQSLGIGKGWIAHLMDCPETTGFDDQLRICNFIRVLPRCQKGESRAFQPYQFLRTFHAKQTRTENILDQYEPQVGYYSTNNVTYSAQSHGGTLNKSPCLLGIVLSFMVVFASKSLSHML